MTLFPIRISASVLVAIAIAAATGVQAQAQAIEVFAPMRLGAASTPPPGFVAMCEADPRECGAQDGESAERVRAWASRLRWERVFAEAGIDAAGRTGTQASGSSLPPGASLSPARDPDRGSFLRSDRRADKIRDRKAPARLSRKTGGAQPVGQGIRVRDLETINRRVNRSIRRASDLESQGVVDLWSAPSGQGAGGDCEDYALAKRRALIAQGVDPDLMSLAIVRTRRGETHAVLLVATAQGEYVLDNLSPWVVRWDRAPYEWIERQAPGATLDWVLIAS
jgi:predicted transglutaminase-like cysteine proteinase